MSSTYIWSRTVTGVHNRNHRSLRIESRNIELPVNADSIFLDQPFGIQIAIHKQLLLSIAFAKQQNISDP